MYRYDTSWWFACSALLGVAAGCGLSPARAAEGGEWVSLSPMNLARQEVGAARIGNKVYVVGGLLSGGPLRATDAVEVYDVALDEWSFVEPLPIPLDHMGAAAVDGKLYVMGGYSADFRARDSLWIYDPQIDHWTSGAPIPSARGACWAVAAPRLPISPIVSHGSS